MTDKAESVSDELSLGWMVREDPGHPLTGRSRTTVSYLILPSALILLFALDWIRDYGPSQVIGRHGLAHTTRGVVGKRI